MISSEFRKVVLRTVKAIASAYDGLSDLAVLVGFDNVALVYGLDLSRERGMCRLVLAYRNGRFDCALYSHILRFSDCNIMDDMKWLVDHCEATEQADKWLKEYKPMLLEPKPYKRISMIRVDEFATINREF
jgi:hypothetical protein